MDLSFKSQKHVYFCRFGLDSVIFMENRYMTVFELHFYLFLTFENQVHILDYIFLNTTLFIWTLYFPIFKSQKHVYLSIWLRFCDFYGKSIHDSF